MKNQAVKSRRRFIQQVFGVVGAMPVLGLLWKRRETAHISLHEADYYHSAADDKELKV